MPLQPYASAFASTVLSSPEPQGTYFIYCSSVSWFSTLAKIERSEHWFTRYCFYLSERFSLEPLKQYSVDNVRYSYDTILTLICQACYAKGMDKQRTIRLSEQDVQAIAAIREEYGFTSDSEALRFAVHTLWREIKRERNSTQTPNKDSPLIPLPERGGSSRLD